MTTPRTTKPSWGPKQHWHDHCQCNSAARTEEYLCHKHSDNAECLCTQKHTYNPGMWSSTSTRHVHTAAGSIGTLNSTNYSKIHTRGVDQHSSKAAFDAFMHWAEHQPTWSTLPWPVPELARIPEHTSDVSAYITMTTRSISTFELHAVPHAYIRASHMMLCVNPRLSILTRCLAFIGWSGNPLPQQRNFETAHRCTPRHKCCRVHDIHRVP